MAFAEVVYITLLVRWINSFSLETNYYYCKVWYVLWSCAFVWSFLLLSLGALVHWCIFVNIFCCCFMSIKLWFIDCCCL